MRLFLSSLRVLAALGLCIVGLSKVGCARTPETAGAPCASGKEYRLDLDTWGRELEASGSAGEVDRLLAQAGLGPVGMDGKVSVEILDARLSPEGPPSKIAQARVVGADDSEALRVAVLRPVAEGAKEFCLLADGLSHDKAPGESPCIHEHDGVARRLSLIQILAPHRDTIVVHDAGGWCGGGGGDRGDELTVAYWGVEGDELVRYFEAVTYEAWFQAPSPPLRTHIGRVAFSGAWPKRLSYTETIECGGEEEDAADLDVGTTAGCTPSTNTTHYEYREGRYEASP